MALFDTDKGSVDRSSPSPNVVDVVDEGAVKAHQTLSTSYAAAPGSKARRIQMANDSITFINTDGSTVGIGTMPTGEFGFFGTDTAGNVVFKIIGSTFYVNDIVNNTNVMQIGKMPDGSYGTAIAKVGKNVSDIFS